MEKTDPRAVEAFEQQRIRDIPLRALVADYYLARLEGNTPDEPVYLDKSVDNEWLVFRAGWYARDNRDKLSPQENHDV